MSVPTQSADPSETSLQEYFVSVTETIDAVGAARYERGVWLPVASLEIAVVLGESGATAGLAWYNPLGDVEAEPEALHALLGEDEEFLLVLDRSTSADEEFDEGMSRWEAIVAALLDDDGPIRSNTEHVAIGVLDYSGFNGGTCPEFGSGVAPALDNFDSLEEYLSGLGLPEDKSEAPTREAIERAVEVLSQYDQPGNIILVTDGTTDDTCGAFDNPGCVTQAYYAVQQAQAAGVYTYVLGIGDLEDDFLQAIANAGTGQPVAEIPENGLDCGPEAEQPETSESGGSAPFWQAEGIEQIGEHLDAIFGIVGRD